MAGRFPLGLRPVDRRLAAERTEKRRAAERDLIGPRRAPASAGDWVGSVIVVPGGNGGEGSSKVVGSRSPVYETLPEALSDGPPAAFAWASCARATATSSAAALTWGFC